jgi:nucleoside-diphosphate-sugar epimerase
MQDLRDAYHGKKVLVTGGLGFIGSNLSIELVGLGADVTIMDSGLKPYGANDFNVSQIRDRVTIDSSDIRDRASVERNVAGKDIIFNLAAQVGERTGLENPHLDVDINCNGHLNVLEACKVGNKNARVLFPGSRFQYGKIVGKLPVDEDRPMEPCGIYSINKMAGEKYYMTYFRNFGLDTVALRITNPFGPRAQVKHPSYCIVNWFVRQALEGKEITLFGDGNQMRDYIYVADLVNGMLLAGVHPDARGRVYNLGAGTGTKFKDMAQQIIDIVGSGRLRHVPWPKDYEKIETGDFVADISRIKSELGFEANTSFFSGLEQTVRFYREHLNKYI